MIDPNEIERTLKRMAFAGAAILTALVVGVGLIGYWIGNN